MRVLWLRKQKIVDETKFLKTLFAIGLLRAFPELGDIISL